MHVAVARMGRRFASSPHDASDPEGSHGNLADRFGWDSGALSDQAVAAVRAKGRTAWHLVGLNEGHGFGKKENQDYQFWVELQFWKANLLGEK